MLYLDSSAIVKLVVPEPESVALAETLREEDELVSSVMARVEVLRAARQARVRQAAIHRAESVLARIGLVLLDESILGAASTLPPPGMRTLDAIHLATALSLQPGLSALITYDARLATAAEASGIASRSPR